MRDHSACLKRIEREIEETESKSNINGEEPEHNVHVEVPSEEGSVSLTGQEFLFGLLAGAQHDLEKARSQLIADAANTSRMLSTGIGRSPITASGKSATSTSPTSSSPRPP